MQQVQRLLEILPDLYQRGLLDASGGSFAVRGSKGVYVSPTQAGPALRWRITLDDLVLFPGPGEASMARAGRQPCRDNRSHRAILAARPDWNLSIHGHSWGLLAFALAGESLPVVAEHYSAFKPGRDGRIHCLPPVPGGQAQLPEVVVTEMGRQFSGQPHGALLLGGNGPLVCGSEVDSTLSLLELLEQLARAQQWTLVKTASHPPAPVVGQVG
ncbi:class II aldolase/adducin family protein [bacterium]|nr:class II aldolase/adducin family protein [bacterium]